MKPFRIFMKTNWIWLLCLFLLASSARAQYIHVDYAGDPLEEKEQKEIEAFLKCEVAFYSRFGLPDTLSMKLTVFERRKDAMKYAASIGMSPEMPLQSVNGVYSKKRKEAILFGREKGKKRSLSVIYHELSHHLTLQVTDNRPPAWLMEGLAEYFEHCEIKKGRLKHALTSYEIGRIRTMYMLGEVTLKDFVDCNLSMFMKSQMTDEGYAYILAHALTTFWVEKVPEELFGQLIRDLRNRADKSSVFDKINRIYPGGFNKFEQDFAQEFIAG